MKKDITARDMIDAAKKMLESNEAIKALSSIDGGGAMLIIQTNQNNNGRGKSNRAMCCDYDLNTLEVIDILFNWGWIDATNQMTVEGLTIPNGTKVVDCDPKTPYVLMSHNGSLYWNRKLPQFQTIVDDLILKCKKGYNEVFKESPSPLSSEVQKMLVNYKGDIRIINKNKLTVKR